jgi:hypothetical protein
MSAIENLEQRLAAVEAELTQLKNQLNKNKEPWWKAWMGAFQDDPHFEKAMKYGQQWRRGHKPKSAKKTRKPKNDRA